MSAPSRDPIGGISVVVPLHDKAATIAATLASVAAQTRPADEILVIDDASRDGSAEIVRRMDLPGLRLLARDTPGPGGYAARNAGAAAARGDWIALLDADDLWKPWHLQSAAEAIPHAGGACIFLGWEKAEASGSVQARPLPRAGRVDAATALQIYAGGDVFHTNGAVLHRDLWQAAGGFPTRRGTRRGGDSEFWLRLIMAGQGAYLVPRVTSTYRVAHSGVLAGANVTRCHPVRIAAAELLAGGLPPAEATALRRLANRKTLQWLRPTRNRQVATKLSLAASLYPAVLSGAELRSVMRSFAVKW